jgi:hypothetical protein
VGPVGTTITITGTNFVGVTSVKLNGAVVQSYSVINETTITAVVAAANTSGLITVTTGAGTASSSSSFYITPTITSFTPLTGLIGSTVTITGTKFIGATAVAINGLSVQSYTVVSATSITAIVAAGTTYGKVSVTTPGGTANSTASFEPVYQWTGTIDTTWNTSSNWYGSAVPPSSGASVTIPTALTNYPTLSSNIAVNNITLGVNALVKLGSNNLNISGNLTSSGKISGNGEVKMSGSSLQTIKGITTISNITINNASGVTITSGTGSKLNLTGTLNPQNGVLNTNGNLVIVSTANGTGRIGQSNNCSYINGNVTVQRYVGITQRWRNVGFPFTKATIISAATIKGFFTSSYSAYTYDETIDDALYGNSGPGNAGWKPFVTNTMTADKGILLQGGTVSSVIKLTGPINMCTQNIPLGYSASHINKGWNLIANPFVSNINWNTILPNNSNVEDAIYRFDPNENIYVSYVNGISTGNQDNIIENGASFVVHSAGSTSLRIEESDKTESAPMASLFRINNNRSILELTLRKSGETHFDKVVLRWGGGYQSTDNFDPKCDAYDMGVVEGFDLSVLGNDGTKYSIFHGSELRNKNEENRRINLFVNNLSGGNYQFDTKVLSAIAGNNIAYLYDNYTKQYYSLQNDCSNTGQCSYKFQVIPEAPASLAPNRFSIIFNRKNITELENDFVSLLNNNFGSEGNIELVFNSASPKATWQIVDNLGHVVKKGIFYNIAVGSHFEIDSKDMTPGVYYVKIIDNNNHLRSIKWAH